MSDQRLVPQPSPEHTTRDPWPCGFEIPAAIVKLRDAAAPDWEIRIGYARGFRKVGRGNVGTSESARWERHHRVVLAARPAWCATGPAWVMVTYVAEAHRGRAIAWKHEESFVWNLKRATLINARAALKSHPPNEDVGSEE